ncbi:hypothetical protein [Caballeronia sp. DA-9]|uniref:hypothetical protein n=1 Tax=Caballeronia sp. DA-9 TaxID=3436237 RepID=UPI003F6701E1
MAADELDNAAPEPERRIKGTLDEEFVLDKNTWLNWSPELDAWLDNPTFSQRADLRVRPAFRHGRKDF